MKEVIAKWKAYQEKHGDIAVDTSREFLMAELTDEELTKILIYVEAMHDIHQEL